MIKSIYSRWHVLCQVKTLLVFGCFVVASLSVHTAGAQQSSGSLEGYWKQVGQSVYIKVVNTDGRFDAEMVRNDWSPGLVGSTYFSNATAVNGKKSRWTGEAPIPNSSKKAKASIRLNRKDELMTRLRPGGKLLWKRSEPIEKRY